jgi:hypothetical protein
MATLHRPAGTRACSIDGRGESEGDESANGLAKGSDAFGSWDY